MLDAAERAFTETEADRKPPVKTGGTVLIRGATVLTGTGKTLPNTDILVRGGKIQSLDQNIELDARVPVIDAEGMFVMAGIIDTHSHFAVSGGVNEGSLSVGARGAGARRDRLRGPADLPRRSAAG
jgi:imidazolonepropionase-like amidohydrolase